MNSSTHVSMSLGSHQSQLLNDVSPPLKSFSNLKANSREKRDSRDTDFEWGSTSPSYTDDSWRSGVTRKKNPHQHGARPFHSVVLVLTVVEPYQEQMAYEQSVCTGTFISLNVVLTLASCVYAKDIYKSDPITRFTKIYTRDGLILSSFNIYLYDDQQKHKADNRWRYASIMVESPYRSAFPKLPDTPMNFAHMKNSCVLAGYGNQNRLVMSNFRARPLRETAVSETVCRNAKRLCLRFDDLHACLGDRGSPLICNGVLYAMYAPKRFKPPHRCISRFAATFIPVLPARAWLVNVVEAPHPLSWFGNRWYVLATCVVVTAVISAIYYLLALFVIKPFDRRVDRQLSVHVQSLETCRSSVHHGSRASAGHKRSRMSADRRADSSVEGRSGSVQTVEATENFVINSSA